MAYDFLAAAREALDRFGINTGVNAAINPDSINIGTDTGGAAHKRYKEQLAQAEAIKKQLADANAAAEAQSALFQQELAARNAATTGAAAASSASPASPASPAAASVKSTWAGLPENALIQRDLITGAYRAKPWDQDQRGFIEITPESLKRDAALRRTMEWGMGPTAYGSNPAYNQYSNEVKNLFGLAGVSTTGNFTGYKRPWEK